MSESSEQAASGPRTGEPDTRTRLLEAALAGVDEVGWANLTSAGIVRRARVSKRTFYEHFETKDACLLALFEYVSGGLLEELERATAVLPPGPERAMLGTHLYLTRLQEQPRVARTLLLEVFSLGVAGLAVRRRVMRRFAMFLLRDINAGCSDPPLLAEGAMLLVGGINELTLEALEDNRIERLTELAPAICRMLQAARLSYEDAG